MKLMFRNRLTSMEPTLYVWARFTNAALTGQDQWRYKIGASDF